MSGIVETGIKFVICWYIAGLIETFLSVLWAYGTGGLAGLTVEIVTDAIFARLLFPLDFVVAWLLSPISIILQLVLAVILFACSERRSGSDLGGLL